MLSNLKHLVLVMTMWSVAAGLGNLVAEAGCISRHQHVEPAHSSHPKTPASTTGRSHTSREARTAPPTNAILVLWIPEAADVWINGQETKRQRLAGVHKGSRRYNLTGLTPNEVNACDIVAKLTLGEDKRPVKLRATIAVFPGTVQEHRFSKAQFAAYREPPTTAPCEPDVVSEVKRYA